MNALSVLKFDASAVTEQAYFLAPEKLLSGNPRQRVWNHYSDPSERFSAGVWSSEVGKWKVSYTEEEYCQILEGTSVITDHEGNSVTVSAGDNLVVPRGFVGTWEVVLPTRKIYVIYEAGE
jgi:uncharacterized cupin superfamily protein